MSDTARLVLAEWRIVRARLLRTRLLVWMGAVLLVSTLVASTSRSGLAPGALRATLALWAILLGTLAVSYAAGNDDDRLALELLMTHPTIPGALVTGRWLSAVAVAGCVYLVAGAGLAVAGAEGAAVLVARGLVPLGAVAAASLAASWCAGPAGAGALLVVSLLPGALPGDVLGAFLGGSAPAALAASVVHLLPTFARAGGAVAGRDADLALCAAWLPVGVGLATWSLAARRAWPGRRE